MPLPRYRPSLPSRIARLKSWVVCRWSSSPSTSRKDREAKQIDPQRGQQGWSRGWQATPLPLPPPARLSQDSNILSRNLTDGAGRLRYIADEQMDDIRTRFAVHVMLRDAALECATPWAAVGLEEGREALKLERLKPG